MLDLQIKIKSTAEENTLEFNRLVELFDGETDMYFKLDLAHILTDLKYREIIPFLFKTVNDPNEDIDYRFEAIIDLIKIEEPEAYDLMMELAAPSYEIPDIWIINDLREFEDQGNKMAKKLLVDLKKKYKHLR